MILTCRIGQRTDTITIEKGNQKNAIWQIFSDKYHDVTRFTYDLLVEVTGSEFTDAPVTLRTQQPVEVALPTGRLKYLNPVIVPLRP